jgi:hypothetical protein
MNSIGVGAVGQRDRAIGLGDLLFQHAGTAGDDAFEIPRAAIVPIGLPIGGL